nr:Wzz/FepE/Etk N-terminal domain-containing protein [Micromonospora sp. DSM 115978]
SGSNDTGRAAPGLSLLKVLGRKWFAIVISVVAFGALGLVATQQLTPTYQSTSKIFLSTSQAALGTGSGVDPTRIVQTQAEFARSTQVVTAIGEQLQLAPADVLARLTTVPSDQGYFFEIIGNGSTQDAANRLVTEAK